MNETGVVARFEFASGEARGTSLTLHPGCLVHRGASHLETFPLAALASVRVAFERDRSRLAWGAVLIAAACGLLALSAPLAALAGAAAAEISGAASGVGQALHTLLDLVKGIARALPAIAAVFALGGGALAVLGWLGTTMLTLSFAGGERAYGVRGRSHALLDFSEALAAKILQLKRG